MKAISIFVFLLSISISTLVLPSIIPKISFIASLLLLLVSFLLVFLNKGDCFFDFEKKELILLPLFALFLLFWWMFFKSLDNMGNVNSNINLFVFQILFFLFFLLNKSRIMTFIRSYIVLVLVMSFFGLLSLLLHSFNLIDVSSHYVNLFELTDGSFGRDKNIENSYIFPYFFGLILSGDGMFNIGSYEFFRISGWAHEPTSAALFVAPAILLLSYGDVIKNNIYRVFSLVVIMLFWLFAMSIGSFISLVVLYALFLVMYFFIKNFPRKHSMVFLSILVILSLAVIFNIENIVNSSLIVSKFDLDSHTVSVALREIAWFVPDPNKDFYFYSQHVFIWSIVLLMLIKSIFGVFYREFPDMISFVLLYVILHTMKGSQESVFSTVFVFFWFYCVVFYNDIKK